MRKHVAILLAMVLVLCMTPRICAVENAQASIQLDAAFYGGALQVTVSVEGAEGVTNGRLSVTYDPGMAALLEVKDSSGFGAVSVNKDEPGKVFIAWVGSSLTSEKSPVATLRFQPSAQETLTFAAQCQEAYAGKTKVSLSHASVSIPCNPFVDIEGHWAEDSIVEAYHRGLVKGVTETKFVPNGKLSRAMFVTILHRMAGCPKVEAGADFEDLENGRYYTEAVHWAAKFDIVKGVGENRFLPHKNITRQEMVTMLYRYAKLQKMDLPSHSSLDSFVDSADVSKWAMDAMVWAVDAEILRGYSGNYLKPQSVTTRGQAATVVCRFLALQEKEA